MRLEEQVALYSVFHRDPVNRAIHALTMPLIILSGLMLLAPLRIPGSGPGGWLPINLGAGIIVAAFVAFLFLDETVAIAHRACAFPLVFVAKAVAPRFGFPALLALNGAVQAISWFLAVQIGHERFEPSLLAGKTESNQPIHVSSNVYFDRGYFLLRNVGRRVSALASFQQFAISPFAATLDVLFLFGYRPKLQARIRTLVGAYLARLATGKALLPEPSGRRP